MSKPEQRHRMAAAIVDLEARRDSEGRITVYERDPAEGGGKYEVAGINDGFHKGEADKLVALINAGKHEEAEQGARDFIAKYTDVVVNWTTVPAVEFYLRDCAFNRGPKGSARILQRALGMKDDGAVGDITKQAMKKAEADPKRLLARIRVAREQYERDVCHRDESNKSWKGLVNRWNNALKASEGFLG